MSEVKVPELAESITEGTIAEWLKSVGDQVEKGENIVELETDKVNVEVISEVSGVLSEIKAEEGETVEVGSVIAVVSDGESQSTSNDSKETEKQEEPPKEDAAKTEAPSPKQEEKEESETSSNERVQATPSARKLAREKGIDLSKVKTQAGDVIRPEDVENAAKPAQQPAKPAQQSQPAQAKSNDNPSKPVVREKLSRRRQTIAKKLLEVSNNTAMLTTFNEVDMTNVMELRKRKKDKFQEDHNGTRLGFMSFFTKASVAALKKYPDVNAEIDGTDLILKQFYDIGVAVSTEEGLVVPIVRD
uniref:2-oxo acid dehydrogenase subunit E2 n=2 Tax=Staphylococcaceae TaxID=90964 RepID=UPI00248AC0C3